MRVVMRWPLPFAPSRVRCGSCGAGVDHVDLDAAIEIGKRIDQRDQLKGNQ